MADGWHVIAQRQFEKLSAQNTFEAVVEVSFQLASGTVGSIEIPARLYTEEYVRDAVEQWASTMRAVEKL